MVAPESQGIVTPIKNCSVCRSEEDSNTIFTTFSRATMEFSNDFFAYWDHIWANERRASLPPSLDLKETSFKTHALIQTCSRLLYNQQKYFTWYRIKFCMYMHVWEKGARRSTIVEAGINGPELEAAVIMKDSRFPSYLYKLLGNNYRWWWWWWWWWWPIPGSFWCWSLFVCLDDFPVQSFTRSAEFGGNNPAIVSIVHKPEKQLPPWIHRVRVKRKDLEISLLSCIYGKLII